MNISLLLKWQDWKLPCTQTSQAQKQAIILKKSKKVTQQIAEDDNKNLQEYCYIINNFIVAIFLAQSHNTSIQLWYTTTNVWRLSYEVHRE